MEIAAAKGKKCGAGKCRRRAVVTVKFGRSGVRSELNLCGACLGELSGLLGGAAGCGGQEETRGERTDAADDNEKKGE